MPIKAVIFDMDGVLVDSEVYWDKSRVEFARDRGKIWTEGFQRLAMGQSTVGWAQVMRDKLQLEESIDEIIAEMKARVIACYEERMPTRPGALESVEHMGIGHERLQFQFGQLSSDQTAPGRLAEIEFVEMRQILSRAKSAVKSMAAASRAFGVQGVGLSRY